MLQLLVSSFHSLLERDSNFNFFVLVLSVSAGLIRVDVDKPTFSIGAMPKDSFLVVSGYGDSVSKYVVDILVV